jgi:hypothetical protein
VVRTGAGTSYYFEINRAAADQEVLIRDFVPPEAIFYP